MPKLASVMYRISLANVRVKQNVSILGATCTRPTHSHTYFYQIKILLCKLFSQFNQDELRES